MNPNEELKYTSIKRGIMQNSKLPQGSYVTIIEKNPEVKREKINKKKGKAVKIIATALVLYLLANGIISTTAIDQKYGINSDDYIRVGSDLHMTEEAKAKIPDGAYVDEFIENLNPIELIQTAKEIKNGRW